VNYVNLSRRSKVRRSFMHIIWFACVWVIWYERNDQIFNNKENSIIELLDKVKYM